MLAPDTNCCTIVSTKGNQTMKYECSAEINGYTIYLKHKGYVYMSKGCDRIGYSEVICTDADMINGSVEIMTARGITTIVPKDKIY